MKKMNDHRNSNNNKTASPSHSPPSSSSSSGCTSSQADDFSRMHPQRPPRPPRGNYGGSLSTIKEVPTLTSNSPEEEEALPLPSRRSSLIIKSRLVKSTNRTSKEQRRRRSSPLTLNAAVATASSEPTTLTTAAAAAAAAKPKEAVTKKMTTNKSASSSISSNNTNNNIKNNSAGTEFIDSKGRCIRHPQVRLRKKKSSLFDLNFGLMTSSSSSKEGGDNIDCHQWKILMQACPDCCLEVLHSIGHTRNGGSASASASASGNISSSSNAVGIGSDDNDNKTSKNIKFRQPNKLKKKRHDDNNVNLPNITSAIVPRGGSTITKKKTSLSPHPYPYPTSILRKSTDSNVTSSTLTVSTMSNSSIDSSIYEDHNHYGACDADAQSLCLTRLEDECSYINFNNQIDNNNNEGSDHDNIVNNQPRTSLFDQQQEHQDDIDASTISSSMSHTRVSFGSFPKKHVFIIDSNTNVNDHQQQHQPPPPPAAAEKRRTVPPRRPASTVGVDTSSLSISTQQQLPLPPARHAHAKGNHPKKSTSISAGNAGKFKSRQLRSTTTTTATAPSKSSFTTTEGQSSPQHQKQTCGINISTTTTRHNNASSTTTKKQSPTVPSIRKGKYSTFSRRSMKGNGSNIRITSTTGGPVVDVSTSPTTKTSSVRQRLNKPTTPQNAARTLTQTHTTTASTFAASNNASGTMSKVQLKQQHQQQQHQQQQHQQQQHCHQSNSMSKQQLIDMLNSPYASIGSLVASKSGGSASSSLSHPRAA